MMAGTKVLMRNDLCSTGRFATPHVHRHMVQPCRHFGHRIPVRVEGDAGRIRFDIAMARGKDEGRAIR